MNGKAEIIIGKPIEEVWTFTANPHTASRWINGISDLRVTSTGPLGQGSTVASKYTYRGKTFDLVHEVTEFLPPSRQSIQATSGPFPFTSTLDLESVPDGTRVVSTLDAGSDSKATTVIFTLFGPFIHMMLNRQLKKELGVLKSLVEAEGAQATEPSAPSEPAVVETEYAQVTEPSAPPEPTIPETAVPETVSASIAAPPAKATATRRKPAASRAKSPGVTARKSKATTTATARKPKTAAPKRTTRTRKAPPKEAD